MSVARKWSPRLERIDRPIDPEDIKSIGIPTLFLIEKQHLTFTLTSQTYSHPGLFRFFEVICYASNAKKLSKKNFGTKAAKQPIVILFDQEQDLYR